MSVIESPKAKLTLRFWKASLAWKNIGNWATGWNTESFIIELRTICNDNGRVGFQADNLLNDMVHDRERVPLEHPGVLVELRKAKIAQYIPETTIVGQQA